MNENDYLTYLENIYFNSQAMLVKMQKNEWSAFKNFEDKRNRDIAYLLSNKPQTLIDHYEYFSKIIKLNNQLIELAKQARKNLPRRFKDYSLFKYL